MNAPPVAETTVDGLERVQAKQMDTLYVARGVFYEIFSAALTRQHGYPLTTQAGPDVLRITTTISELDLAVTPGTGGTHRMHVVSPADLTLLMELRDSQSGALLVRAVDKEKGRTFGNLAVEDAVSTPRKPGAHSRGGPTCSARPKPACWCSKVRQASR